MRHHFAQSTANDNSLIGHDAASLQITARPAPKNADQTPELLPDRHGSLAFKCWRQASIIESFQRIRS